MKCPKCGKPIKEDTDGDSRYCQGHWIFENIEGKEVKKNVLSNSREEASKREKAF